MVWIAQGRNKKWLTFGSICFEAAIHMSIVDIWSSQICICLKSTPYALTVWVIMRRKKRKGSPCWKIIGLEVVMPTSIADGQYMSYDPMTWITVRKNKRDGLPCWKIIGLEVGMPTSIADGRCVSYDLITWIWMRKNKRDGSPR